MPTIVVDGISIEYATAGDGPVLVFIHGIFVNGTVWSDVVARLSDTFRCVTPTLPLGGHAAPVPPRTDLTPESLARLVPGFLEALKLRDVTVVCNDTGGGLCLIALDSGHPGLSRVSRLVFTNCDSYESFPPKAMRPLVAAAKYARPLLGPLLGRILAKQFARKGFVRSVAHTVVTPDRTAAWFDPLKNIGVRRDTVRMVSGLHASATLEAAGAIARTKQPVLLAWGLDDDFFPLAHAERLAADFPHATVEAIPHCKTFVMLDAPERLAELIAEFAGSPS